MTSSIINNPFYLILSILGTPIVTYFIWRNLYYYYCYFYWKRRFAEFMKTFRPPIDFVDKYKKELENMKNTPVDDDTLKEKKNSFVMENTPQGMVIMTWNQEKLLFEYYSDKKDIPYRFLDTVCRKYVKANHCKCIYIDINKELETCKEQLDNVKMKIIEAREKKRNDEKSSMFVTAKKKGQTAKEEEYKIKDDDLLIKENVNIFKHSGMIRDFQFIKTPKKEIKTLSYADFMNK